MNFVFAIILTIALVKASSLEAENELEAVFQGKCDSNLCSQLCYELHDGMFECDCTQGYELSSDGYTCRTTNISLNNSHNNNDVQEEEEEASDIFYQKGVSFSAKLDEAAIQNSSNIHGNSFKDVASSLKASDNQSYNNDITTEFNFDNSDDEIISVPKFNRTSWIAFKSLKGANLVTEINLEFRPEAFNGTILLSGERSDMNGDFIIINIHNGYVEFLFDCGSGTGKIRSTDQVNLHQWNSLTVYRFKWDAWVELNENRRIRGRSVGVFSRITFRSPVFLGGIGNISANSLLSKGIQVVEGFNGCVRKFIVNGHAYNIAATNIESVGKFNIRDCSMDDCMNVKCLHGGKCQSGNAQCLCPLGFSGPLCGEKVNLKVPMFNGTSYLRYTPLGETAIIWLELKIILKPNKLDGLIMFSGRNDVGDFIALSMNFGFLDFIFDLGSGMASVRSKFQLSLDEWHTIKISRTARLAVMKVDQQPEIMTVGPNGFWHLSLPYSFFIGGVPKTNILPSNLRDRGSFTGCIKMLEINNRNVELIEDALGGLNVGDCRENGDLSIECTTSDCNSREVTNDEENINFSYDNAKIKNKSITKYSLDVVALQNNSDILDNTINERLFDHNTEETLRNDDESNFYKRIVRVSLQKSLKKNQGMCFKGNNSYILLDNPSAIIKKLKSHQTDINLRFKIFSPNGLILWASQQNNNANFLSLSVEDGYVHLRYDLGAGDVDISNNLTRINDGLWHRIRILRKNQKGTLKIDGGAPVYGRCEGKNNRMLNIDTGLYIGGISNSAIYGLEGCISEIIINSDGGEYRLDFNNPDLNGLVQHNVNSIKDL